MKTRYSLNYRENDAALLELDDNGKNVYVDGQLCPLTQQEYSLLHELVRHGDKAVSREHLLETAWGYICPGETRTVDVHIQRLRRKLGFSCIETVYRMGYRLKATAI